MALNTELKNKSERMAEYRENNEILAVQDQWKWLIKHGKEKLLGFKDE